jgi:hypothetical protein
MAAQLPYFISAPLSPEFLNSGWDINMCKDGIDSALSFVSGHVKDRVISGGINSTYIRTYDVMLRINAENSGGCRGTAER